MMVRQQTLVNSGCYSAANYVVFSYAHVCLLYHPWVFGSRAKVVVVKK